ncbi:hypothetical protein Nepgr_004024 [Nepenthes gracilis]|uniref:Uncharacterized protein n=1 Tax=Nepenthes gracilis TaxID=150966 RepID=A0AAD3S0K4_NEPGR|nr:hypothetical protein Nepgr_004024 [Nepenthes gracilis]
MLGLTDAEQVVSSPGWSTCWLLILALGGWDSEFILAGSLLLDFAAELVSASVGAVVLATTIHSFYLMM